MKSEKDYKRVYDGVTLDGIGEVNFNGGRGEDLLNKEIED